MVTFDIGGYIFLLLDCISALWLCISCSSNHNSTDDVTYLSGHEGVYPAALTTTTAQMTSPTSAAMKANVVRLATRPT